jgi:hypothetical protein
MSPLAAQLFSTSFAHPYRRITLLRLTLLSLSLYTQMNDLRFAPAPFARQDLRMQRS